jgi:DNA-binding MarR family transcriptional regulator
LASAVNRLAHVLRGPVARHGVTPTRLTALATLEKHGPLRAGELADRIDISAASMSCLTEVLLNGGWADRKPDPAERRAFLLSLSSWRRQRMCDVIRCPAPFMNLSPR